MCRPLVFYLKTIMLLMEETEKVFDKLWYYLTLSRVLWSLLYKMSYAMRAI